MNFSKRLDVMRQLTEIANTCMAEGEPEMAFCLTMFVRTLEERDIERMADCIDAWVLGPPDTAVLASEPSSEEWTPERTWDAPGHGPIE